MCFIMGVKWHLMGVCQLMLVGNMIFGLEENI